MPESEIEHVTRVMEYFKLDTILISKSTGNERVYIDGELVHDGPMMSAEKYQYDAHVVCNTNGEGEWECSSYDGEPQEGAELKEASL